MSCGTYHEFSYPDDLGNSYCVNCGTREYVEPESDPDAEREMLQEAGLL